MAIFFTVIITLGIVVGLFVFAAWLFRDDIARRESEIEAWHRAWQVQQVEYDTEQRLRDATRTAMNQMLSEVRKHDGGSRG